MFDRLIDEMAKSPKETEAFVRRVNRDTSARQALCEGYRKRSLQVDYARIPSIPLWHLVQLGTTLVHELRDFPAEAMSEGVLQCIFNKFPDSPYSGYGWVVQLALGHNRAFLEFQKRVLENPEVRDVMAVSPGMSTTEDGQHFQRLHDNHRVRLGSSEYDTLVDKVLHISQRPELLLKAGLDGKLPQYINKSIKTGTADNYRANEPIGRRIARQFRKKHPIEQEGEDYVANEEQMGLKHLHYELTLPRGFERYPLTINWDILTPAQRLIVQDVIDAYNEGYRFGSKQGMSFSQRWGKDYERKKRVFSRARKKLRESCEQENIEISKYLDEYG